MIMQVNANRTAQIENSNKARADADDAWRSFLQIIDVSKEALSTAGQLFFIAQWSRADSGGPIFGALCLSQQILEMFLQKELWTKGQYYSIMRLSIKCG